MLIEQLIATLNLPEDYCAVIMRKLVYLCAADFEDEPTGTPSMMDGLFGAGRRSSGSKLYGSAQKATSRRARGAISATGSFTLTELDPDSLDASEANSPDAPGLAPMVSADLPSEAALPSGDMPSWEDLEREALEPTDSHPLDHLMQKQLRLSRHHVQSWMDMSEGVVHNLSPHASMSAAPSASDLLVAPARRTSRADNSDTDRGAREASVSALSSVDSSGNTRHRSPPANLANSTSAVERFLRQSVHTIQELQVAMQTSEYVMLIMLAGTAGLCRALLARTTVLLKGLQPGVCSAFLIVWPGVVGLTRAVNQSQLPTLSSLRAPSGHSVWYSLFLSVAVPKVMVVESAGGRIVCPDALTAMRQADAVAAFPWRQPAWAAEFMEALAANIPSPGHRWAAAEDRHCAYIVLLELEKEDSLPEHHLANLNLWLAMYTRDNMLVCYCTADQQPVPALAHLLFVDTSVLPGAADAQEFPNTCHVLAPRNQHQVQSLDVGSMDLSASLWGLSDSALCSIVRELGALEFKRLSFCPLVLAVSLCPEQAPDLGLVFAKAVEHVYAEERECKFSHRMVHIMYCTATFDPGAAEHDAMIHGLLTNTLQLPLEPLEGKGCLLLVVSLPKMQMAQAVCTGLPDVCYVEGMITAYLRGELAMKPLNASKQDAI